MKTKVTFQFFYVNYQRVSLLVTCKFATIIASYLNSNNENCSCKFVVIKCAVRLSTTKTFEDIETADH